MTEPTVPAQEESTAAATEPALETAPVDPVVRGRHRKDRDVRRVRRPVTVIAAVVVLALLGVAIWTGLEVRDRRHDERLDDGALAAGRRAAVLFTSYDYRHLTEDLDALSADATGTFKTQFAAALQTLSSAITSAKGVSVGTVEDAGLRERAGNTAVVLAAVDAAVTNTSAPNPVTRRYRLQITLSRTGSAWLISDITPVS